MGGMIAQRYACQYPERLGGLVLADTFTPPYVSLRDRIERGLVISGVRLGIRLVGYERAKGALLWFGRKLEGDASDSLRVDAFPEMETAAAVNAFRATASFHETTVDLGAITVPTLVLYGEHETSIMRRHAPRFAAELPDATVREVPDAGHATPWDNPEYFNDAVRTFVEGLPVAGRAGKRA